MVRHNQSALCLCHRKSCMCLNLPEHDYYLDKPSGPIPAEASIPSSQIVRPDTSDTFPLYLSAYKCFQLKMEARQPSQGRSMGISMCRYDTGVPLKIRVSMTEELQLSQFLCPKTKTFLQAEMQLCQKIGTLNRGVDKGCDCYFEVTALLSETRRFIYGVKFRHNCVQNGANVVQRVSTYPSSMSSSLKTLLITIPTLKEIVERRKATQYPCSFPMPPPEWRPEVTRGAPSAMSALQFHSKVGWGKTTESSSDLSPSPHGIFTTGKPSASSSKALQRTTRRKLTGVGE